MREKKEINIRIGERIKNARDGAQLTQEQLAERIEVSAQYVSDLERGVVGISIPTLTRLCLSLGVSSDNILFGDSEGDVFTSLPEKCRHLSGAQKALLSDAIHAFLKAIELEKGSRP